MTLDVFTESHGLVESGFFGPFVQFTRLGEHSFVTKHFCGLVRHFATNSNICEARILSYGLDKFWRRHQEDNAYILDLLGRINRSDIPGFELIEVRREIGRSRKQVLVEDDVDVFNEGEFLPVKIIDSERTILVGEYRIPAIHFSRMAAYVAMGGFLGWDNNAPEFAEPTFEALRNSTREFYREIREEMK